MPRGDKNQIMSYRIPAIDDVVKVFSSEASKVLNLISTNRREIATLEQLRDALLPKLMSGEIDASKVELPTPPEQAKTSTNGRLSKTASMDNLLSLFTVAPIVSYTYSNKCS